MADVISTVNVEQQVVAPKVKKTVTRKKKAVVDATTTLPPAVVVTPVPVNAIVEESKIPLSIPVKEELVIVETPINTTPTTTPEVIAEVKTEVVEEEKKKPTKRVATKEKLLSDMDNFYNKIKPILETAPGCKQNLKDALRIQSDMRRILKVRNPDKKVKDNTNSGFMKPIKVSDDLRTFLELDGSMTTPITRAYLTTRLCSYIKKNELQNPDDKRIIFPDENLRNLFAIQENEKEPLTYYNIQKRIQKHIFRIEEEPVETVAEVSV
jgi:chromatin remodeling complex protein RSC6